MSDYITELETELVRAGRERQRRRAGFRSNWSGRRPRAGAVATALGVTVAIAVAALAALLVGHSRPRAQPATAGRVPAAAQGLVSMLAVLRRPQTEADRTLPASLLASGAGGGQAIVPSLTRLVATVPSATEHLTGRTSPNIRLYLIVTAPRAGRGAGARPAGSRGDLVSIAWVSRTGSAVGFGVSPGVPAVLLHASPTLRSFSGYNLEIVPDGVLRVRWSFNDGTEYAPVQHNVALAPSLRAQNAPNGNQIVTIFEPKYLESVTWYGSHGQAISSFPEGTANPLAPGNLAAQLNLQPPTQSMSKAAGIVEVYENRKGRAIKVTAVGLAANTRRNDYAVWLYTSPSHSKLLGFVSPRVRSDGRLSTAGALPPTAHSYAHILITVEDRPSPKVPGKIVLEARLRFG